MVIIGLTGGIGSGKSTVATLFQELGVPLIDTDQIAREAVNKEQPAFARIVSRFGVSILNDNGQINRSQLRTRIFENPADRIWLEKLLHPLIRQEILARVNQLDTPYCLVIIPLLFETPPNPLLQHVLVVDAPERHQYKRVIKRDQIPHEQLKQIMRRQVSRQHRLSGADDVIYNDRDILYLKKQILRLHEKFVCMAQVKENRLTHSHTLKKEYTQDTPKC